MTKYEQNISAKQRIYGKVKSDKINNQHRNICTKN